MEDLVGYHGGVTGSHMTCIALDVADGKMYWGAMASDGSIGRANLNGGGRGVRAQPPQPTPFWQDNQDCRRESVSGSSDAETGCQGQSQWQKECFCF